MATYTHKLGTSRAGARTRVWLEGKRLASHGFTHGEYIKRTWDAGKLVLTTIAPATFATLDRANRGIVAGTPDRPIIDITGEQVAATFTGDTVKVTYRQHRITIEG